MILCTWHRLQQSNGIVVCLKLYAIDREIIISSSIQLGPTHSLWNASRLHILWSSGVGTRGRRSPLLTLYTMFKDQFSFSSSYDGRPMIKLMFKTLSPVWALYVFERV